MARNGTGVFAVLNPILIGGLRSSDDVNENYEDMGDAITDTLPLDAQAGMTGQFKAAQGSTTFPSISFGSDRNTGFRRRASDQMSWVAGGVERAWNTSAGMNFAFGMDVAGDCVLDGDFEGSGDLPAIEALSGTGLSRRTGDAAWSLDDGTSNIQVSRFGHGVRLPTGIWGDVRVPFAATLTGISMFANASGSATLDIWKDTYANFPPTVADSICGSSKPAFTSTFKMVDEALAGWTTTVAAGDVLRFNMESISDAITAFAIFLRFKRFT